MEEHATFKDFEEWKKKLVGFGPNGASVNLGRNRSVATLLKDVAPWIVQIHCMAHRLELAVKDCFKGSYFTDTVVDTLTTIYYFYHNSPKRFRELHVVAEIMSEQILKPARANGTRWVEHKVKAIKKMMINYGVHL